MKRSDNPTVEHLTVDELQDRIDDLSKRLTTVKHRMSTIRAQTISKAAKYYNELAVVLNKLDDITDLVSSVQVRTTVVCHLDLAPWLSRDIDWRIGETEIINVSPINAALKEWKATKTKARKLFEKIVSITAQPTMEIITEVDRIRDQKFKNKETRVRRAKAKGR